MMAFTAPAAAPARTFTPIRFAAFFTPRLAVDLREAPLRPDALRFAILRPPERAFALARFVVAFRTVFRRELAFLFRLVVFFVAIVYLLILSLCEAVGLTWFASWCAFA